MTHLSDLLDNAGIPEDLKRQIREAAKEDNICGSRKMGEYNSLRCCAQRGHTGDHCYVVIAKAK